MAVLPNEGPKRQLSGHSRQEIADKGGYKTASAVHKRIARIASAYEDYDGAVL